ncbi:DUF2087 domain-containing protein [Streptomyces sp. NPDC057287]|uniref:DUF2087 domain-containing protein n=1 Tax=Streptomyces sp. NPDC057287 TaxID=3346086 RepID=UPI00362DB2F1
MRKAPWAAGRLPHVRYGTSSFTPGRRAPLGRAPHRDPAEARPSPAAAGASCASALRARRVHTEREVDEALPTVHADCSTLRRHLVAAGLLERPGEASATGSAGRHQADPFVVAEAAGQARVPARPRWPGGPPIRLS